MVDLDRPWLSGIKEMKRKADVEGLINVLKHESDVLKREAAAEVLGEIGDERAVDALIRSSVMAVSDVADDAFRALVKIASDARFASMKVTKHPTYLCSINSAPEEMKWPAMCCMCLRSPQVSKATACTGLGPIVRMTPTSTTYLPIRRVTHVPYCSSCLDKTEKRFFGEKEGVQIEIFQRGSKIVNSKVRFRNPIYARKFLELNI